MPDVTLLSEIHKFQVALNLNPYSIFRSEYDLKVSQLVSALVDMGKADRISFKEAGDNIHLKGASVFLEKTTPSDMVPDSQLTSHFEGVKKRKVVEVITKRSLPSYEKRFVRIKELMHVLLSGNDSREIAVDQIKASIIGAKCPFTEAIRDNHLPQGSIDEVNGLIAAVEIVFPLPARVLVYQLMKQQAHVPHASVIVRHLAAHLKVPTYVVAFALQRYYNDYIAELGDGFTEGVYKDVSFQHLANFDDVARLLRGEDPID